MSSTGYSKRNQPFCIRLVTPQAPLPLSLSAFDSHYYSFHHLSPLPPPLTITPFFHYSSLLCILSPLLFTSLGPVMMSYRGDSWCCGCKGFGMISAIFTYCLPKTKFSTQNCGFVSFQQHVFSLFLPGNRITENSNEFSILQCSFSPSLYYVFLE